MSGLQNALDDRILSEARTPRRSGAFLTRTPTRRSSTRPRHRPRARPPGHHPPRLVLAWRRRRLRDLGPRDHRPADLRAGRPPAARPHHRRTRRTGLPRLLTGTRSFEGGPAPSAALSDVESLAPPQFPIDTTGEASIERHGNQIAQVPTLLAGQSSVPPISFASRHSCYTGSVIHGYRSTSSPGGRLLPRRGHGRRTDGHIGRLHRSAGRRRAGPRRQSGEQMTALRPDHWRRRSTCRLPVRSARRGLDEI